MTAKTARKPAARKPAQSAEFLAEAGAVLSEIAADAAKQMAAKKPAVKPAPEKKPAAPKKSHPLPDGFTLGMKVTSSKDGLTYEVVGGDKSPLYVALRSADNKRVIRSIKTLTPVVAKKTAARKTAAAK
jgi:hypothetical protein